MPSKESNVTVVVPVYNVEQYLRRCIDSLLRQSVRPLEIILVDDGSPDGSGAICDEYSAKNACIKVIHKSNGGLSSARKAGWEAAKGKLICFIDSDDYVDETYIEKLSAPFSDPDVELSMCAWSTEKGGMITPSGLPYADRVIANIDIPEHYILPVVGSIPEKDAINTPGFAWIRLYSTNLLKNTDFVSEREYFTEDIILNILYASRLKGKIAIVNEPLYYYCINPGSLTLRYRKKAFEMRLACNRLCRELVSAIDAPVEKKEARLDANIASAVTYAIYNIGRLSDYKLFIQEIKQIFATPEVVQMFSNKHWPSSGTWQKVIGACHSMKAYHLLFYLLKLR